MSVQWSGHSDTTLMSVQWSDHSDSTTDPSGVIRFNPTLGSGISVNQCLTWGRSRPR